MLVFLSKASRTARFQSTVFSFEGHNKHALHGRGKTWQRNDIERLMRLMVMSHYLDEELFINKDEMAVAYLRVGPKAQDLLSGKDRVRRLTLICQLKL